MTNSKNSPRFSWLQTGGCILFLASLACLAGWHYYAAGSLLYYGDAQAHLNISRGLIDSRSPGYEQLGTVWLPVLHLICLPFVAKDSWWESGLAATIPVTVCFVVAGTCLFLCAKRTYSTSTAAFVVLLCFALNRNVLYLATITMTEMVFLAGLTTCLLAILTFRQTNERRYIALAIVASWWMSLTRYDGWFLIPFIGLFLATSSSTSKVKILCWSVLLSAVAPAYWMAHNWWQTSNALDFFDGPYSAAAIQGDRSYPGFHDWPKAFLYYSEAGRLCCGNFLLIIGILGIVFAIIQRRFLALCFLVLTPIFYVWSVHSSKTPIHLPTLWPHSYYNTRYGIALVVLTAFAAGSIADSVPKSMRLLRPLIAVVILSNWLIQGDLWKGIVWKESQVNSDSRRAWTSEAAQYLSAHYQLGSGMLVEFGDMAGIFGKAGIPLKEALHEGSGPSWFANTMPSGLVRQTKWAMAQEGDKLSQRLEQARSFKIVKDIKVAGAPTLRIYEVKHEGDMR